MWELSIGGEEQDRRGNSKCKGSAAGESLCVQGQIDWSGVRKEKYGKK